MENDKQWTNGFMVVDFTVLSFSLRECATFALGTPEPLMFMVVVGSFTIIFPKKYSCAVVDLRGCEEHGSFSDQKFLHFHS